jgi:hypothetical protein
MCSISCLLCILLFTLITLVLFTLIFSPALFASSCYIGNDVILKSKLYSRYSDWLLAVRPRGRSSSPGRVKNFLFFTASRLAMGPTQPPIQWVPETLSPGVNRHGREADHSPPTSSEVKKIWICTYTPPYARGQLYLSDLNIQTKTK